MTKDHLIKYINMRLFTMKHNYENLFKHSLSFDGFLSEDISPLEDTFKTNELKCSNDFYGIATILKKYSGYRKPLRLFIEHGLYFGEYTAEEEISGVMPALITLSQIRSQHIHEKSKIPTFCIGPYIKYAERYWTPEEVENIKNQYGKILLVFPQHTIDGISLESNNDLFISFVNEYRMKEGFDSVFISLYYKNVTPTIVRNYVSAGFVPVCSGNRNDPLFLSRQRSLIETADMTLSDNVGTHVGYCYALGKDHVIFDSGSRLVADDESSIRNVPELYLDSAVNEKKAVETAFKHPGFTKEKDEIARKFWGLDCIRSSEELYSVFDFCNKEYFKYFLKHEMISGIRSDLTHCGELSQLLEV